MTMTEFARPTEGQTWVHRQYGTEVQVQSVNGDSVVVTGRNSSKFKMLAVQLNEHYYPAS